MGINIKVIEHPLIKHKMALLRDEKRSMPEFRKLLHEIGLLMAFDVTKNLQLEETVVKTPVAVTKAEKLEKHPVLVNILRAGIGMLNPFMEILPKSRVGFLGMNRDEETLQAHSYYNKIPMQALGNTVLLLDPMLATGGSALSALDFLKSKGVTNVTFVCLVAAPEGVAAINKEYPNVTIYTAALDEKLNEKGYIVPGLGDAGDRIFGTGDDENL
ncbi:MAG: uracil phosphoribosyltransferase [Sulfurovum sp.]|nr:uracil phosphoribosyltransferase [Sulfurovum sp.]